MRTLFLLLAVALPLLAAPRKQYPVVNNIRLIEAYQELPGGKRFDYSEAVYQILVRENVSVRTPVLIPTDADLRTTTIRGQLTGPDSFEATATKLPRSRYVIRYQVGSGPVETVSVTAGEKLRFPAKR